MVDDEKKINVLVLGQTPPPYHGQAIAIQRLIEGKYDNINIKHLRFEYSSSINEIGVFRFKKVLLLFATILRTFYYLMRYKVDVVHYPPAGGNKMAIFRDIVFLLFLRKLKSKIVFMFHAEGLYEWLENSRGLLRWLAQKAYFYPTLAIQVSSNVLPIGELIHAKTTVIIPHGLPDYSKNIPVTCKNFTKDKPIILYVGILHESKGIMNLLEAAKILKSKGTNFCINLIGDFTNKEFQKKVENFVKESDINDVIKFFGLKIDEEKWAHYRNADIFCFPTFYENETFGQVILEAMVFSLPVIATRWRGTVDLVIDGQTGFLVQVKDSNMLSEKMLQLIVNEDLRKMMGAKGRERYLQEFSIEKWYKRIEAAYMEAYKL